MPCVSVVMTSYNYGRFISEAIRSVLNQSFDDLELIIVDDASNDGSQQIIKSFEEEDARIRIEFHEKNLGFPRTVNEGWDLARGRFIANISSDDFWKKEKLERQIKVLENDEDLVVWSEGEIIDAQGRSTGELFTQVHRATGRKKSGDIFVELLKGNFIFASSRIFKRKNLLGRRYSENLKYLSDYQFAVDMAIDYDYYFIQEPLTKYRMQGNNTLNRDIEGYQVDAVKLVEYFLATYGDKISNDIRFLLHLYAVNTLKCQLSQANEHLSQINNELLKANSQLSQAEREMNEMKRSVIWRALMAYQERVVDKGLPHGTGRRGIYDNFIEGCRRL